MTGSDVAAAATPWLAALFGIGAAGAAQHAFSRANEAGPVQNWNDAALPRERDREISERAKSREWEIDSENAQTLATHLATGAAIEGAAASQHDLIAIVLAVIGLVVPTVGSLVNRARLQFRKDYVRASKLQLKWYLDHKLSPEEREAGFAREHPREANVLKNAPESWR